MFTLWIVFTIVVTGNKNRLDLSSSYTGSIYQGTL